MRRLLPGGCHVGCLTTVGRQDAVRLGKQLHQRYMDELRFLQPHYDPDTVYVRSTNITRTVESARSVLTGLYGANGRAARIETTPDDRETLYPNTVLCPRLQELFKSSTQ